MNTVPLLRRGDRPHANYSLPARLMAVTHFMQKQAMDQLVQRGRYGKLSLSYSQYIALLVEREWSPGELAERLGVSKQVCSKTVQELEALELIHRRVNSQDSRSSVLSLSAKGLQLLRDVIDTVNAIQQQLADTIGEAQLQRLLDIAGRLCVRLDAGMPGRMAIVEDAIMAKAGCRPSRLAGLLTGLGGQLHRKLSALVSRSRFPELRAGVGQLLGMISGEGRRLQYIAGLLGVSKQAVAATAAELEQLGYAVRTEDPEDRRQIIVSLSPRGRKLLREVVDSVDEVEAEIRAAVGDADYQFLNETISTFYEEITEIYSGVGARRARVEQLSKQLLDELGPLGARALAQKLMNLSRGKP